ncbi:MAG: ABC transporter ATP-binding protein [Candidatus Dormibacter sp.]|uniref:ABC transporter ATP-binding protein n=1 Tax=Candidatus Dormibacter sp. TaxID=2973982 RepID=UPI000DB229E4|nr:MAG: ABC transporter ATP-binding protein [Candidatus Dormibacteraeota bacterium]
MNASLRGGTGAEVDRTRLLEVRDIVKRYQGVAAVDRATLNVAEGSITALIGPNGAGKTSLFNIVSGFARADSGSVRYRGRSISRLPPHRVARAGSVRTFQQPRVLRRLTVLDNLLLAGPRQPAESFWRALAPGAGRRDQELRRRALELLALVRLDDRAEAYAGVLSGGQRKLLEFAKALMAEPLLVLLDEPLAGVNPTLRELLLQRLREVQAGGGITFLVIEHDLGSVLRVSDEVAVMSEGRVIFQGSPEATRRDPAVIDAYLGSAEAIVASGTPG